MKMNKVLNTISVVTRKDQICVETVPAERIRHNVQSLQDVRMLINLTFVQTVFVSSEKNNVPQQTLVQQDLEGVKMVFAERYVQNLTDVLQKNLSNVLMDSVLQMKVNVLVKVIVLQVLRSDVLTMIVFLIGICVNYQKDFTTLKTSSS